MALNGITDRFDCLAGSVAFHLWLAIPMAAAATLAAAAIVLLFRAEASAFWIGALSLLFLCVSGFNAALLLSDTGSAAPDRIGPLVEAATPALVCVLAGVVGSRHALHRDTHSPLA
jgi:hypothetical protein